MSSQDKVAVVTGAGTGIGKSAALALLGDGYRVGLVGRRKELLDKTVQDAGPAAANTLVLPADVGNPESVKSLFAQVRQAWG
ncbi:MAG: SDR family oxidoreductase, partial [Burkholderiales bacterium]